MRSLRILFSLGIVWALIGQAVGAAVQELDAATQSRLDRGYRMVELLKQPQYQPMEVVDEVMVIFAGNSGCIDKLPVNQVQKREKAFLEHMKTTRADVRKKILEKKELTDELKKALLSSIEEFQVIFAKG